MSKMPQILRDVSPEAESLDVPFKSVAIQRLIDEIRVGGDDVPARYNRIYNRHNRS